MCTGLDSPALWTQRAVCTAKFSSHSLHCCRRREIIPKKTQKPTRVRSQKTVKAVRCVWYHQSIAGRFVVKMGLYESQVKDTADAATDSES